MHSYLRSTNERVEHRCVLVADDEWSVKTIIEKQIGKNDKTTAKELQKLQAQTSVLSCCRFRFTVSVFTVALLCFRVSVLLPFRCLVITVLLL